MWDKFPDAKDDAQQSSDWTKNRVSRSSLSPSVEFFTVFLIPEGDRNEFGCLKVFYGDANDFDFGFESKYYVS